MNQYFWTKSTGGTTDIPTGSYVTEVPQANFTNTQSADYCSGGNLVLQSNRIRLRLAAVTLAELTTTGLKVYEPNDSTNPVAQFLNSGIILGKQASNKYNIVMNQGEIGFYVNTTKYAWLEWFISRGLQLMGPSVSSGTRSSINLGYGTTDITGDLTIDGSRLIKIETYSSSSTTISAGTSQSISKTFTMPSPYRQVIGVRRVETNSNSNCTISSFDVSGDGDVGNTVTLYATVFNKSSSNRSTTVTWEVALSI